MNRLLLELDLNQIMQSKPIEVLIGLLRCGVWRAWSQGFAAAFQSALYLLMPLIAMVTIVTVRGCLRKFIVRIYMIIVVLFTSSFAVIYYVDVLTPENTKDQISWFNIIRFTS